MGNPNTPVNRAFASEILDLFINEEDGNIQDILNLSMATMQNNYFANSFDLNYYNLIDPMVEADLSDPLTMAIWQTQFQINCAILRSRNPSWSNWRIYWETSKEMIHLGLDLVGLAPVIGEVADLTNGVLYTIEGDGVNATLSYASTIPIAGWASTSAKFAIKTVNSAGSATTLKWIKKADGVIAFGDRKQFKESFSNNCRQPAGTPYPILGGNSIRASRYTEGGINWVISPESGLKRNCSCVMAKSAQSF